MERAIFARLERLVRTLAVVIGLTTSVAVPAGFGTVAYWDQIAFRQFQARLAADRLSEYAYIQGPAWRFGKHRLEELISFVALPGDEVCQIVYDQAGRLVFVQASAVRSETGPGIDHRDGAGAGWQCGHRSQPVSVPRQAGASETAIGTRPRFRRLYIGQSFAVAGLAACHSPPRGGPGELARTDRHDGKSPGDRAIKDGHC